MCCQRGRAEAVTAAKPFNTRLNIFRRRHCIKNCTMICFPPELSSTLLHYDCDTHSNTNIMICKSIHQEANNERSSMLRTQRHVLIVKTPQTKAPTLSHDCFNLAASVTNKCCVQLICKPSSYLGFRFRLKSFCFMPFFVCPFKKKFIKRGQKQKYSLLT